MERRMNIGMSRLALKRVTNEYKNQQISDKIDRKKKPTAIVKAGKATGESDKTNTIEVVKNPPLKAKELNELLNDIGMVISTFRLPKYKKKYSYVTGGSVRVI